ncbi:putative tubby-like domain-containing protein [Rosa chinensis]|uniref:Putative tubby-like domain-containing protein n=1 Tax=Rosa chinensis TaxID=74649 RepID=A0A2P6R8M8_ROSCH|nr:putative tubby-like domain-containing protein [Rosa chinensis]
MILIPNTPSPSPIISPKYCNFYPISISIVREVKTLATDDDVSILVVKNADGNTIVGAKQKFYWFRHDRLVLYNAAGKPFDFHLDTKLKVFLAKNKTKNAPDFKLKGNWFERSCAVYAKNSSTIVAEMNKKCTVDSVLFKKDNFMVTVYPGMDYAFIVALFVILDVGF